MTSNWNQRWQAALQEQHRGFFDYNKKNLMDQYAEYVNCPVCGSGKDLARLMFEKDMFKYYRCNKCSLLYMNPRLNNKATAAFYNSTVNEIYNETKFDAVSDSVNTDNQINAENVALLNAIRNSGEKGKLLEIGCAKGFFLNQAKISGYQVWGLELNKKNCSHAAGLLGDRIFNKDLFDVKFDDEMFDVVYMRDVIEHLPDPKEIMREINRILKPKGIVFVETHNVESLIHKIVHEKHTTIFGFEHPVHWSPQSIKHLFNLTGFEINKIHFQSMDFTLQCIFAYFIWPTFTTILPKPERNIVIFICKLLRFPLTLKPLCLLDKKITPCIAQLLKRGSTMKVFAIKDSKLG